MDFLRSKNSPTSKAKRDSSSSSPMRKFLTLSQRMDVIEKGESGKSIRDLAFEFGVGRTQIHNIMKRKAEIYAEFESAMPLSKKRNAQITGNEPINELVKSWYLDATQRRINVTGTMMREKALQFAKELNIMTFHSSAGWLDSFKKRNNIQLRKFYSKSGDVDCETCAEWISELPSMMSGYEPKNIYNMDETGLFLKNSFHGEGEKLKDCITVALCTNFVGEKEPALVIGKLANPKAFGCLNISSLPVIYTHSRKALMTKEIFTSWINNFNDKLRGQNRHVLLFLDNAPCHPKLFLSNVKLLFFPQNTSLVLQPLDQGIIQIFKLQYRTLQFQFMMAEVESGENCTGTELVKKVSILNAVHWVAKSWSNVKTTTINNCFKRSGFVDNIPEMNDNEASICQESEPILETFNNLSQSLYDVPFNRVNEIDDKLITCESGFINWNRPASEILETIRSSKRVDNEVSDDDQTDEDNSNVFVTNKVAFKALNTLRDYLQQKCLTDSLEAFDAIEKDLLNLNSNESGQAVTLDLVKKAVN